MELMQAKQKTRRKAAPIWMSKKQFLEISGLIAERFDTYKCRHKWATQKVNGRTYVNVLTIANREKYGITADNDKLRELIYGYEPGEVRKCRIAESEEAKIAEVRSSMAIAMAAHPMYYNEINEISPCLKTKKKTELAKKAAVAMWMKESYTGANGQLKTYHTAYQQVIPNHLTAYAYFNTYLTKIKDTENICRLLAQKRANSSHKGMRRKRTAELEALLQMLYTENRKVTIPEAHKKVMEVCKAQGWKPVSKSTVGIVFREFDQNAYLYQLRNGAKATQKNTPYVTFERPKYVHSMWQADGKKVPFLVQKDGEAGAERWTVFYVQEVHSQLIVGYSCGKVEDTELILEGLETAVRNAGYWPAELGMDAHSFHRTKNAAQIAAQAEQWGCIITASTNPQAKAMIERGNQELDAVWKNYDGYLGKGVLSKGINARPSEETQSEYMKRKNYKSPDEVKLLILTAIHTVNNAAKEKLGGLTPQEAYDRAECKHGIRVSESDIVKLFRRNGTYKVTRRQITIMVGGVPHEFSLPARLAKDYDGKEVTVTYEDLRNGIYISDVKTGKHIEFLYPKGTVQIASVERTEKDIAMMHKHIGSKKGVMVQARKKAEEDMAATLMANPDLLHILHPAVIAKDIKKEVENNAALAQLARIEGININNMPLRPQSKPPAIYEQPSGKTVKKSPFYNDEDNVIERIPYDTQ